MSELNLISWNVNGIRAIIKKDFISDIKRLDPDILCLQETKGQVEEVKTALTLLDHYEIYVNSSKARKGYSGTSILSKSQPLNVDYDLGLDEHDQEGRVISAEYQDFFLVNVYTPNSGEGLKRLGYRQEWDKEFLKYIKKLEELKPVIITGDFNVANNEIDLARPKQNYNKSAGYTQAEIDGFENIKNAGYIDSFRYLYPEEVKYTYWNYKFKARERNVGWRIDYFMVSEPLKDKIRQASIHNDVLGSDHCPVSITLEL